MHCGFATDGSARLVAGGLSTRRKAALQELALAAMIAFTAVSSRAQDIWLGGMGNWYGPWLGNTLGGTIPPSAVTNWDGGFGFPSPADNVDIGALLGLPVGALNGIVTLNTPANVAALTLGDGAFGGLNVVGATLKVGSSLEVGAVAPGTGRLDISNGGVVNDQSGIIGVNAGASGEVIVSASQWNNSQSLIVGDSGSGTLVIRDGGTVNPYPSTSYPGINTAIIANGPSSSGSVIVGLSSTFNVGNVLQINAHGSLVDQGSVVVGRQMVISGAATVAGGSLVVGAIAPYVVDGAGAFKSAAR